MSLICSRMSLAGRAARLLVCGALLAAGCLIETADRVPAYPGASVGPGYRQSGEAGMLYKQIYYTSDSFYEVVEFYGQYASDQSQWSSKVSEQAASWSQNMKLDPAMTTAVAIEPNKPGKLIVVVDEGRRTTIRAFSSHPDG